MLIVSPEAFNRKMNLVAIAPITSGRAFARKVGFAVPLQNAGRKTAGVILCHQLRMIDIQARKGRYLETIPMELVKDVLARLEILFQKLKLVLHCSAACSKLDSHFEFLAAGFFDGYSIARMGLFSDLLIFADVLPLLRSVLSWFVGRLEQKQNVCRYKIHVILDMCQHKRVSF